MQIFANVLGTSCLAFYTTLVSRW